MEIESIRHKALRNHFLTGSTKGLPGEVVGRLGKMLQFLLATPEVALPQPPNFGAHLLTGNRCGIWSLTVTRNWRLTFLINDFGRITEVDLEDYH